MAQFDVYRNPNQETNRVISYLLDVQADLLDRLSPRVVVPQVAAEEMGKPPQHLNSQFEIEEFLVIMSTAELASVSMPALGDRVLSLHDKRNEILGALDFLFTGI